MTMAFTDTLSGPASQAPRFRPSASIVILAWNQWPMTDACLRTLRPTLGIYDEVIVVDNGSVDETPLGLGLYPWVKVVTNSQNRGFAGGNNDGAAIATRDVVVFLNNDTLLTGRWLDELLAPFEDPTVGATGPRSNFVSGPQIVDDADYFRYGEVGLHAFVARWERQQAVAVQPLHRLVGFCLAVRRDALQQVVGFDEAFGTGGYEDDDLCRRLLDKQWQLLMVNRSFVHHHGHATFDGNGLDWRAIEEQNRLVFEAKHGGGGQDPNPIPVDPYGAIYPNFEPALAMVVECPEASAALVAQGWEVVERASTVDVLGELDQLEPRPTLVVVAGGHTPSLERLDVPVLSLGESALGVDIAIGALQSVTHELAQAIETLASSSTFGGLMLACRQALDVGDLPRAFEAVRQAEMLRSGTPQAANAMAVCAHVAGDHEQAVAFVRRALSIDATFGPAIDNLAALGN